MFRYRWCLVPNYTRVSKGSSLGSIVHRLFELSQIPDGVKQVEKEVGEKIQELRKIRDSGADLLGDYDRDIKTLEQNFNKAKMMVAIFNEKFPRPAGLEVLGREIKAGVVFNAAMGKDQPPLAVPVTGILDELDYMKDGDLLFVRDYKNTTRPISFTLTGYQWTLQPRIYRILVGAALAQVGREDLVDRVADGFILDILQVPSIEMSGADRDFTIKKKELKSGPRKGQVIEEKEYFGDPDPINYLERCKLWYAEKGLEAASSFAIRFNEDPMNAELMTTLNDVAPYAGLVPVPELFPRDPSASFCKEWERVCEYYPLCSCDPSAWPAVIESQYKMEQPTVDNPAFAPIEVEYAETGAVAKYKPIFLEGAENGIHRNPKPTA